MNFSAAISPNETTFTNAMADFAGPPQTGTDGRVIRMTWMWKTATTLRFDPATDVLDFGWFGAMNFTVAQVNGSVVIAIPANKQTYTLAGVALGDLTMANIRANEAGARAQWQAALAGVRPGPCRHAA